MLHTKLVIFSDLQRGNALLGKYSKQHVKYPFIRPVEDSCNMDFSLKIFSLKVHYWLNECLCTYGKDRPYGFLESIGVGFPKKCIYVGMSPCCCCASKSKLTSLSL